MKEATPIDFSGLEAISLQEMLVQDILKQLLPEGAKRLKLLLTLEQALQRSIRGGLFQGQEQIVSYARLIHRKGGETEMVRLPATFEPGSSHVLRIETTLDGTIKAYLR